MYRTWSKKLTLIFVSTTAQSESRAAANMEHRRPRLRLPSATVSVVLAPDQSVSRMADPELEYRAYFIGNDGHFASFRAFVCNSDDEAVEWARQFVDCLDVELWSGKRFVSQLRRPPPRVD
jgi:hypothetical protein